MNNDNLLHGNPATQFVSGDNANGRGAVENGRKSGESRRRKADLRKMAQDILDGTYKDRNGKEITGAELVVNTIVANLADPKGKNWSKAIDLLVELTGANKSAEEKAAIKAQTELTKAKTKLLQGGDDTGLKKLDEILKGLEDNARTETDAPTE